MGLAKQNDATYLAKHYMPTMSTLYLDMLLNHRVSERHYLSNPTQEILVWGMLKNPKIPCFTPQNAI